MTNFTTELDPATHAAFVTIRVANMLTAKSDPLVLKEALDNLANDLRWMTESRSRWKAACERQDATTRQLRAFDEEAAQ